MTHSPTSGGSPVSVISYLGQMHSYDDKTGSFSPVSSTLLVGEKDVVLIDAQHMRADVEELIQVIAATGKRLTSIYVTHGHADHWFGIGEIIRRFPGARAFATAAVLQDIKNTPAELADFWRTSFGQRAIEPDTLPELLEGPLEIEGNEIQIIELPQADISPTTAVFVPAVGALVPADALYNKIHMMFAFTGPDQWKNWLKSIDILEALNPKIIVCGHKRHDKSDTDVRRIIDESRDYIRTFSELAPKSNSVEELVVAMAQKFWDFGNLWTLQFSAWSYFENYRKGK
jgi:glyoxylase-like metal-dependent hydrolase (beta-lactamase superfamily II)